MIHHVVVEDTTWPVDLSSDDEDSAEWVLRYGTPERREAQRMSVASIVSAYKDMTDPRRSLKDCTAMLRRALTAAAEACARPTPTPVDGPYTIAERDRYREALESIANLYVPDAEAQTWIALHAL